MRDILRRAISPVQSGQGILKISLTFIIEFYVAIFRVRGLHSREQYVKLRPVTTSQPVLYFNQTGKTHE